MTKEQIEKKALKAYPKMSMISEPHGVIPADTKSRYLGDANEESRKVYIKALTEFFTPEMMWKIFQAGKEVVDELNGKESSTEYFGRMILKKLAD